MRLQSEFENQAESGEEAQEEGDGEYLSHSFSPYLSTRTSERPFRSRKGLMFLFCSLVKRQKESLLRRAAFA